MNYVIKSTNKGFDKEYHENRLNNQKLQGGGL